MLSSGPDGETPFRTRILRFLEKRSLSAFAVAPGDDVVNAVLGEGFGESDPAHSTLPSLDSIPAARMAMS